MPDRLHAVLASGLCERQRQCNKPTPTSARLDELRQDVKAAEAEVLMARGQYMGLPEETPLRQKQLANRKWDTASETLEWTRRKLDGAIEDEMRVAVDADDVDRMVELVKMAKDLGFNGTATWALELSCRRSWERGALAIMDAGVAPNTASLLLAVYGYDMLKVILRMIELGVEVTNEIRATARRLNDYTPSAIRRDMVVALDNLWGASSN